MGRRQIKTCEPGYRPDCIRAEEGAGGGFVAIHFAACFLKESWLFAVRTSSDY
jgi:hypothetical protein